MNHQMKLQVLDCTLRDGGYYCQWDFSDSMVRRYIDGMCRSGIDIIEIGFRSLDRSGFSGQYKYCHDRLLRDLFSSYDVDVAVMIDGKDFIDENGIPLLDSVDHLFASQDQSPVSIVRMTSTVESLDSVIQIGNHLKDKGYRICINLMQASLLPDDQLDVAAQKLEASKTDVFYLADSFGGLSPDQTEQLYLRVRKNFSRTLGFHSHDNLGLALANSLAALKGGATIIDSSLLGMGRGAGNLRTEQLLLYLSSKMGHQEYDPSPLFEVASTEMSELHQQFQWGPNLPYMLSGIYNVHPMYVQNLLKGERYSSLEVVRTLEALHDSGDCRSFKRERLIESLRARFSRLEDTVPVTEAFTPPLAKTEFKDADERPLLLIGAGPSVQQRSEAINLFIEQQNPIVIECNLQGSIQTGTDHYTLFTNNRRLDESMTDLTRQRKQIILGLAAINQKTASQLTEMVVGAYPYRVVQQQFQHTVEGCTIPYDVVAMFAFAFALNFNPKQLYLCGFDGYIPRHSSSKMMSAVHEKLEMEKEMETFLGLFQKQSDIELISLTPTAYDIKEEALYAYLR